MGNKEYSLNIDMIPLNIAIYKYDVEKDDFKFVSFNVAAENTENIRRDMLVGKYFLDVFPTAKKFGIFDLFKKVHFSGEQHSQKTDFYRDGHVSGWREHEIYKIDNGNIMSIYKDLTLEKSSENRLKMLGTIVDNSFNEIYVFDADSFKFTYLNKQAHKNLGYDLNEIVHLHPWDIKPQYSEEDFKKYLQEKTAGILEAIHKRKDGTEYFIEAKVQKMILENGSHYVAIISDVTQKKINAENLSLSKEVIDSISEAVIITDLNAKIIDVNPAYVQLTGFKKEDVIGKSPNIFKSAKHDKAFYEDMWYKLLNYGVYKGEIWDTKASGELFLKDLTITSVKDEYGIAKKYVGLFSDITKENNHKQELETMAFTDSLTQLSNRVQFKNILKHQIDIAIRNKSEGAILLLDLDMFKKVNDTLGHPIGDELLIAVAKRLKNLMRESDTVSRIGGDEFTIILSPPVKKQSVQYIAKKIIDSLCKPYIIDIHEVFINSSIGIAFFPDDGKDADVLIKSADLAMYKAKDSGRGNYRFFQSQMHDDSIKNRTTEVELRDALAQGKIVPYYQPKINPKEAKIVGVEALVRWNHHTQGILSPINFLGVAEDSGLIHRMGEQVFVKSLEDIKELNANGYPELSVAVNLSSKQFEDVNLIEKIIAKIRQHGFNINNLELEITESLIMQNVERAIDMMKELTSHNIKISIDDFGTGYSSLNYLKKFPISYLKIDKSFIDGIVDFKEDKAIIRTIIAMAESLDIEVIAEGIENIEQEKLLSEMECHLCQGYLYSKPLSFEELKKFLTNW